MKKFLLWVALFLYILSIFARGNDELTLITKDLWDNPLPQPDFIESIQLTGDTTSKYLCVTIIQKALWTEGFVIDEASNHIINTIEFKIDGQDIAKSDVDTTIAPATYPVYDTGNNLIGSYGGYITSCLSIDNLAEGLHLAHLMFESRPNLFQIHTWAFEINSSSFQTPAVPTIMILPTSSQ